MHVKLRYVSAVLIVIIFLLASCSAEQPVTTTASASQTERTVTTMPSPTPSATTSDTPALSPSSTKAATPKPSPSGAKDAQPTPKSSPSVDTAFVNKTKALPATSTVNVSGVDSATIAACFSSAAISDAVFARMVGKTFGAKCTTKREDLRYVRVLHIGFDGKVHAGELVVNKSIAGDVLAIFRSLYKAKYRIEKMKLEDDYNADDDASMADNNTSSFNFRVVEGSSTLSKHALGLAIDINPLYNPYVFVNKDGSKKIEPPESEKYSDRTMDLPYIIKKGDMLYNLFIKHGFTWGGSWDAPDYQHFSKAK